MCHDTPDLDSLTGVLALETIAADVGFTDVDVLYSGTVPHQQTRGS